MKMETKEETINAIRAKAEAEIAKVNKEAKLREALPIQPLSVCIHPLYNVVGSMTYNTAKTWADVQNIIEAFKDFKQLPGFKHVTGGVSIRPYPAAMTEQEPIELLLTINTLPNIQFYVEIDDEIWKVSVDFPLHLIGCYRKDNPYARTRFRYQFESKKPLNSVANFGGVERTGEGSKSMSYCRLTKEKLKQWVDEDANNT